MKPHFILLLLTVVLSAACGPSPIPKSYYIQLPVPRALQTELLGESHWRLEYYDSSGNIRHRDIVSNGAAEISVRVEYPSAILAWPYWPEKSLAAGYFYPAGAIFPFDAAGDTIILTWEAGVEAFFFRELEKARESGTETKRLPEFFDWKRFRFLLYENGVPSLMPDPWMADWKNIAERTVSGGFRQSYLKPEPRTAVEIIVPHDGPWLAASPFRPPEYWEKDEKVNLMLSSRPEVFVCRGGRLNLSSKIQLWVLNPDLYY